MSNFEDKATACVILAVVLLLATMISLPLFQHDLWCKVGHYEQVFVPAHEETDLIYLNDVWIPISKWVPDHYKDVWVCDEEGR